MAPILIEIQASTVRYGGKSARRESDAGSGMCTSNVLVATNQGPGINCPPLLFRATS